MTKLPDRYDAKTREKFWQNHWKEQGVFAWKNDRPRAETFVIDTPPPTVSGLLHMGHVFSYTQADFVARFQRMLGKDVFYPMGFDDNGLPTERLVEKIIGKKAGIYEAENGYGSFVSKCREVVDEAEKEFEEMFNSIALSVDWAQKYQTISPESQKISQASFLDLYHKGFVEKKFEPVFWDISDRTALAQADLVDKEVEGMMNYIFFGVEGSEQPIEIMTTRPELLPACVAVMVHPDDARYKHLHGKHAITPLFGVKVPIIVDEDVQTDKGTGAVMCCTFGDETDIKWWKKYDLKTRVIIGRDGRFDWQLMCNIKSDTCYYYSPPRFFHEKVKILFDEHGTGKTLKDGKEIIITALRVEKVWAEGENKPLLFKQEPITRAVKCAERSGVPIEILVVPQWFIKILDKKEQLKAKANECAWHPDYMRIRIEQWIDGLQWDWCISRQRFFGVAFPVWRIRKDNDPATEEEIVADIDQLPIDPLQTPPKGFENYRSSSVINDAIGKLYCFTATKDGQEYTIFPETDIMDTWATSSISPQLSSKGISAEIAFDRARHEKLFPADMRPQAHEIIRTWAFYTIAKAMLHENSVPWKNLMISGWCLAADKTKMSKSKGNVVTPTALIEEKGSDIVRYWASTSHLGADTAYSEEVFKIGQKLITKLFNAAKFASMHFEQLCGDAEVVEAADLWVLSKLYQTVKRATESFEKFEYARAREAIEEFFWKDFCDNYLEICKVRSYGLAAEKFAAVELSDEEKSEILRGQESAIHTLRICLNTILKLFAPFIPHVCDEIYSTIFAEEFAKTGSINARGNWPKLDEKFFNKKYHDIGEAALAVLFEVRKFKSEKNISMKTKVQKIRVKCKIDLSEIAADLRNVCNATEVEFVQAGELVEEIIL